MHQIMGVDLKSQIDTALIALFVKSTKNVLSTMIGVEAKVRKPDLRNDLQPTHDVSGIVGFTGEMTGSVIISFHEETARSLVKSFTMEDYDLKSDDFADAVGEICNMIAGNAKKDFGIDAGISIPNVVIGRDHYVTRLRDVPCVVIPCVTEYGEFSVEVNIKKVSPVAV